MRHAIVVVVTIAISVTTASADPDPIRIASGEVSWGESVETDVNYVLISNEGHSFFEGQAPVTVGTHDSPNDHAFPSGLKW